MATALPAAVTAARTGPGRAEVLGQVARLAGLEESTVDRCGLRRWGRRRAASSCTASTGTGRSPGAGDSPTCS
ncbi:hypothetical protein [Streptomyces sp. NPDC086182]|uniref:hypothetical protein n=1 Tax=Streptomyces sp. NPDC086182 TaxID=3155058 RepID=UPI0034233807